MTFNPADHFRHRRGMGKLHGRHTHDCGFVITIRESGTQAACPKSGHAVNVHPRGRPQDEVTADAVASLHALIAAAKAEAPAPEVPAPPKKRSRRKKS